MPAQRVNIKIGGPAGSGVKSTGLIIARALTRMGCYIFEYSEYPSLIRGGHNCDQILASTTPVYSQISPVDILLAFNRETVTLHKNELKDGSVVLFDGSVSPIENKIATIQWIDVPMLAIARKTGSDIMANTVGIGAVAAVLDTDPLVWESTILNEYSGKSSTVSDANLKAFQQGFSLVSTQAKSIRFNLLSQKKESKHSCLLLSGNEAIGLSAIASGIGLYAGYPMTPTTSILHFLSDHQQEYGYIVKQPEDEIAAANMVIGSMHAGVRALCGTSGGGFALMNETLALSGMTETPLVIVLGQRPGPATGLPTWTEQGELQYAIHAGHGEFPRFVIAPGDPTEAFSLIADAFNLAERFQTPVILLVDKYLGESVMSVPSLPTDSITIDRGAIISESELRHKANFQRYALTDTGVSPRSLPGMTGGIFCANSDEHEYHGLADESIDMRVWQHEKRLRKSSTALSGIPGPFLVGNPDAPVTIITWGSCKLPALEAVAQLGDNQANVLHFTYLWPLNAKAVSSALAKVETHSTLLIEGNATGQFQSLLKEQIGFEPSSFLRRFDGRPFYPEQLIEKIQHIGVKQ